MYLNLRTHGDGGTHELEREGARKRFFLKDLMLQ